MSQPPGLDGGDAPWKAKAAAKRAAELAKIPSEWRLAPEFSGGHEGSDMNVMDIPAKCGILTSAELEITEKFSAISLAQAVQSGLISSSAVAVAFCKRAAIAQQLTNCLTETFFDEAIKRGQFLDSFLAEHKRPIGPLHGVPISLKDPFNHVGVAATLGLISYLDRPVADQNSPLVDILLELGAILYCKTNIPQTMMSADSDNNVFGKVLNPHRLSLGAGGSSGGEGALVAMRGSIIGVGTDIGGSVRIPALCCGTYGFKPSNHRIPSGGQSFCSKRGTPSFPSVAGPLSNSFEDLSFFTQNVIATKPWDRDASAIPFPWRSDVANSVPTKLRIGYLPEDLDFKVHPPVRRVLEASAKKLTAAGITVVPLTNTPSLKVGFDLVRHSFSLDNSKQVLKHVDVGGEPIIPSLVKTMHTVNSKPEGFSLEEVFDLNVAKSEYKIVWNEVFVDNQLDVILCPGAQHTAVPHDCYGIVPYTGLWNVLEYPGIIIPLGEADRNVDTDDLASPDPQKPYNAKEIHGAPTSVQVVARNYQDEELIAACRVINQVLKS